MRGVWRVGGSFLTVVLLGWGVVSVVAQISFDVRTFTRVVTTPVRVVDVHVGGEGSIDVVAVPGSTRVVAHGRIQRGLVDTHATFAVRGDRVEIRSSCSPVLGQNCKASYRLQVPPDVRVVAHAEGGVHVTGTSGTIDANADHGSITLTRVSGSVVAHTSQGSVRATDVRSSTVRATSDHGDVSVRFTVDPKHVDADATHGSVRVTVPDDGLAYRVRATASHGSTHVTVPTDSRSRFSIATHADHGDVTVEPAG